MKFTYDREADALSVELLPQATSHRTLEIDANSFVDFDIEGRVIGLELLAASERYPSTLLAAAGGAEDWLTLAEAGAEAGLSPDTLRVQLNQGRLEGRKVGRDWQVSRAALWNYLESRAPQGARREKKPAVKKIKRPRAAARKAS